MTLSNRFFQMLTSGIMFLALFYSNLALSQTTYYVKYNSTANSAATGTLALPFSSVSQAVTKLGAGTFELLLVDNPVYQTASLTFPVNSNYTIRPYSLAAGQTYFSYYLNKTFYLSVKTCTLTLQQIQLIDLDTARATNNPSFRVWVGALLTLDRVKFADISYTTSYNTIMYGDGTGGVAELSMKNCEFTNLVNARMQLTTTRVTIVNTTFTQLTQSRTTLMAVISNQGPDYNITLNNVTVQNSSFPNVPSGSSYGFLYITKSSVNMMFQDFALKDSTIANKVAFMIISANTTGMSVIPVVKGRNITITNLIETNTTDGTTSQIGIFNHIQGNVSTDYSDVKITNMQLRNSAFIQSFQLSADNPVLAPTFTLSNLVIQNSTNAYFYIKYFDTTRLDNVQLRNTTYGSPNSIVAMFALGETTNAYATNFQCTNTTGPIFKTSDVFNQYLKNWTMNNISSNIKWSSRYPVFVSHTRDSLSYAQGISQGSEGLISMENMFYNGYYDLNSLTSTGNDLGTYGLAIISEFGKAYLNHSRFYNMKMSSFGGGYTNHLLINNLTVDSDPSIPINSVPTHAIFKWGEIQDMTIINSNFLNQKNMIILIFYFLHRSNNYEAVTHPRLAFDNLTVINNTVNTRDLTTAYPSLFNLRTPLYPVTASFTNSIFKGNTIITAAILTDESLQVDVDFINNTFVNNNALLEGGVIAGKSMRGSTSTINIVNNYFGNNSCLKNGGVFFFLSTQHNIFAADNTYENNYAKLAGGVGYFSHADFTYTETNGTYLNNSAGSYGGSWYLSVRRKATKEPLVKFIGTTFEASSSGRDGGAFYIQAGDVYLENTSFNGSSATEAGGDVYLVALASIAMSNVNSTASYSPQGSFMFAEATTDETMTLQNLAITDISQSTVDTSLVVLNAGSMILSDSVLKNIYSPLFKITSSSAQFLHNSLENIQCHTESTAYCLMQGSGAKISVDGFYVDGVRSNKNLIVMESPSGETTIRNADLNNLKKDVASGEYFVLTVNKANSVVIQNTNFTQLEFSGINSRNSSLKIANTIFSNDDTERILQDSTASVEIVPELRYIVLASSNSTINDTDFIANTPAASSLSGGAIQITGNRGTHSISGGYFEGNNGKNGGAISIEGTINSLTIDNSAFINNAATQNGGSIYLAGQGTSVTPVINEATFQGNEAVTGGAIYVSNSPLRIQNSVFYRNTAENGAGIASLGQSSQRISLLGSTFTENNAQLGSALLTFGEFNFDTQTNTFTNNAAVHGGDIGGRPHHIWVKVYQVSETFLFLSGISSEYIRSHYQTALIYDSHNASLQTPLTMKPGRVPNYLFEFEVLDELNQNITLQSMDLNLAFYTLNATSELTSLTDSKSNTTFGTPDYSFNESSGLIFNNFYTTGKFDDSMILTVKVVAEDNFSNQSYTLPVLQIPLTIGYCSLGEYYESSKHLCIPCNKGSFSVDDPFLVQTCKDCPKSATCLGGSVVYPVPGYWRMDQNSDNFMKCANTIACIGGEGDEGKNISFSGVCGTGYEGVGCGTCSSGHVKAGLNNECVSCLGVGWSLHVKYIFFAFMRVGLMVLAVWLYVRGYNNQKSKESALLHMSIVKVAIDFMQLLSPILILHTDWPYQVRDFLDAMSSPTSMNRNNFSMDCIIATIRGTNRDIVFIKSVILLLQPAFIVGFAALCAYFYMKITGKKIKDLMINLIITAIVVAYICQPDILQYTFQLFRCENYGSTENPQKFLFEDTSVKCWESKHALWVVGLGIPSVILWLFVPVGVLVRLIMKRQELRSQTINRKYDLILEKYQGDMFYWELIILSRKIILIVSSIMSSVAYLQTYLGFSILIIAYLFHKQFQPYSDNSINRAESINIVASAGIMYTGLYFTHMIPQDELLSSTSFLFAIDIIAGLIFFGYCIYVVRAMLKKRVKKLTKKITKTISAANKLRKASALYGKTMIGSDVSQSQNQSQGPPLLEFGKNTPFSNMSFTPNARGDSSPSRFKIFSTKLHELQSPHSAQTPDASGGILKTDPIVTGADDAEKMFSPKSQTLVLDSRNILTQLTLLHKTRETLGERNKRLISSPTQERHISFKSVKSVDALCDEIDEDIHDAEEAIPKLERTNVYVDQQDKTTNIYAHKELKDENGSNTGNSSNDEMPNNPTANKRSKFYARMGKSTII